MCLWQPTVTRIQSDHSRGWTIEGSLPPFETPVPDVSVKHIMEGGRGMPVLIE